MSGRNGLDGGGQTVLGKGLSPCGAAVKGDLRQGSEVYIQGLQGNLCITEDQAKHSECVSPADGWSEQKDKPAYGNCLTRFRQLPAE